MGRLAGATLDAGGYVTGIIPTFLIRKEHPLSGAQEMLVVDSMHERKQAMFDRADAFVALPGGIGTLEELVEQLTWVQLNRHTKPILLADIGGFWRPLLALIAHMRIEGFVREGFDARYLVAEKIEDVLPMLRAAAERGRASASLRPSALLARCDDDDPQRRFVATVWGQACAQSGGRRSMTKLTWPWLYAALLARRRWPRTRFLPRSSGPRRHRAKPRSP